MSTITSGSGGLSTPPDSPKNSAPEESQKELNIALADLVLKTPEQTGSDVKDHPTKAVKQPGGTSSEELAHKTLHPAFPAKDPTSSPQDKEKLFETAKIEAANSRKNISDYIQNYGFDPSDPQDKEKLFEIAKIAAAYTAVDFSRCLKNYGLDSTNPQDKEKLFELAKILAANEKSDVSHHIKNFGFNPSDPEDKEKLFEIAKLAATKAVGDISKYFKNYGLDPSGPLDKEKLFELAKFAAANYNGMVSEYILNYGLDPKNSNDKEKLFEIAKSAAEHNMVFSEFIKNYGLDSSDPQDKEKLFEIAKLAAANYHGDVSEFIKNYGLDPKDSNDKEKLFEIAKIAASNERADISPFIKKYGFDPIQDKEKLFEIAKIAAANKGVNIAYRIKNFGFDPIQDKEKLLEIAKIAAANKWVSVSPDFRNYGFDPIQDKEKLFEIVKIAAVNKGDASSSIKFYGLGPTNPQDKEKLFEIAKILATCNKSPRVDSIFIDIATNYVDLGDSDAEHRLIQVFNLLFPQNPSAFLDNTQLNRWPDIPQVRQLKQLLSMIAAENIPQLQAGVSGAPTLVTAFEKLKEQTNPQLKKNTLQFLGFLVCQSLFANDKAIFCQNIENLKIVALLGNVYDPSLRLSVIGLIGELLGGPNLSRTKQPYHQLPILLFDALFSKGASPESIKKGENAIITDPKRNLRDGKMSKALMKTLIALNRAENLSSEESIQLIESSLKNPKSFQETLRQLNLLYPILSMDGGDLLQQGLMSQNLDFAILLEKAFIRKIPALAAENGFSDKFLSTFQASRSPMAIFQYAASLSKLNGQTRESSQKALCSFITSVLNDSFLTDRMATEGNLHLETLHNKYPDLFTEWTKGGSKEVLVKAEGFKPLPLSEQIHSFFVTKIIKDQHLEGVDLFKDYLKAEPGEVRNAILKKLENMPAIPLQQILVEMADPKFATLKPEKQKDLFDQLEQLIPPESPFFNDMPLLKQIIEGKSASAGERPILLSNTDNPYDLLLCGTEVAGSCQNITGGADLNRGVLGYLLNGHRMITLKASSKTPDQESILGRAIFRLLLDSEEKPVLLLERIYPQNLEGAYKKALKAFALDCASQLNCSLVSAEEGDTSQPFGKEVKSLGGRIGEYVDAAGGIQEGAVYTTKGTNYVTI